jgi:hypothetical protein
MKFGRKEDIQNRNLAHKFIYPEMSSREEEYFTLHQS